MIPYADFLYFGILLYIAVPTLLIRRWLGFSRAWVLFATAAMLPARPRGPAGPGASRLTVYLPTFQTVRPGSFSRTAQSVPPAVTKRVLRSSPPKAQLVHSSRGIGIVWSNSPAGEKM